ncbi:MAG: hypothetical protein SP4CHLAM5_00710 [Chlamydiia bacterium]|nr:hypothetical protein [Chlamydiia bacterium]MCH9617948.1 hypothetical protein [Chlamydiia bacterium]
MNRLEEYMRYGASDHVKESKWNQVDGRVNQKEAQTRSTTHQVATQQILQTPLTPYQQRIYGGTASSAPQRSNSSRSRSPSPAGGSTHRVFSRAPVSSHRPRSASPPPQTGGLSSTNTALQTQLTTHQQRIYGGGASSAPQRYNSSWARSPSPAPGPTHRFVSRAPFSSYRPRSASPPPHTGGLSSTNTVSHTLLLLNEKLYYFIVNGARKNRCTITPNQLVNLAYLTLFALENFPGAASLSYMTKQKKLAVMIDDRRSNHCSSITISEISSTTLPNIGLTSSQLIRKFPTLNTKLLNRITNKLEDKYDEIYD